MLWLILIIILLSIFYYKVKKAQSYWEDRGIPHLQPHFILGNLLFWQRKPIFEKFQQLYFNFPDERYHGVYQFTSPILIVKDPDLIKQITVKEFDSFLDHRSFIPPDVDPFWNKNLFAASGEHWRDLRTMLSPSFTSSKMKAMFNLIDESAQNFVRYFENEAEKNPLQELEMKDIVTRYTNDVIATTAFGLKVDSLRHKDNDFYLTGKDATDFKGLRLWRFILPMISPFLCKLFQITIISKSAVNYFTKIIVETIKMREEQNIVRPDMIHLLMEAQKGRAKHEEEESKINEGFATVEESKITQEIRRRPLTTDDIVSQAMIFFLAGFDTVSTAMSFALYELAINPDVQSRLRDEILSIDDKITYENVLSLKYLDMVVSEVLRKWPPTMITDRKVTKPFTIQPEKSGEKPLHLEKGIICWLVQCGIQRDPKYYPEPDRFDPERFSDENKHNINPVTYMPFGIGPRNCIGSRFALLEIKLLLSHLLKSFEIVPTAKTPIPMVLDQVVMGPKDGMWLGFKKI